MLGAAGERSAPVPRRWGAHPRAVLLPGSGAAERRLLSSPRTRVLVNRKTATSEN